MTIFTTALLSLLTLVAGQCTTESQPNPIAAQYPNDVTGTINGTTAIIPIPYSTARGIVPAQYGILTHAYQSLIPNLPAGMFPAVLEALLDHDVKQGATQIPDFQRIAIKLPFIDRLNDNTTSFKYTPPQLISANLIAFLGSTFYGQTYLGNFTPSCNPYSTNASTGVSTSTVYTIPNTRNKPAFVTTFTPKSGNPYGVDVFKNVTNQPSFGSGVPVCDNYITLFNSSVTLGRYVPVSVQGSVSVSAPFYASDAVFNGVWGYHMDNAFIERNNVPCENLRGYHGTGSGD